MNVEKVVDHIVDWLTAYSNNSGTSGFVVGVSGGIDSAVTSALCARTGIDTICVEMPIHQSKAQVSRAVKHIEYLITGHANVRRMEIELTPTFESFKSTLPEIENNDMALINTRARIRMTALYYVAGAEGKIVVGTGNKVEDFGVGFFTKYGDGGVDVSPIADLNKTEVYALGDFLGVNDQIMDAPPTDGLWGDNRTDEDQIGASYPELEWAMEQQDLGKAIDDFEGRQKEVYAIYTRLNWINQHKMVPIPVCVIPAELR